MNEYERQKFELVGMRDCGVDNNITSGEYTITYNILCSPNSDFCHVLVLIYREKAFHLLNWHGYFSIYELGLINYLELIERSQIHPNVVQTSWFASVYRISYLPDKQWESEYDVFSSV